MKRERLIDVVLAAAALVVFIAAVVWVIAAPTDESWITREGEWEERTIEIYTENLQVKPAVGDAQEGVREAARVLAVETRELDGRRVVWMRLSVAARRWRDSVWTAYGGELIPGGTFAFYGPGYKVDGWILSVE